MNTIAPKHSFRLNSNLTEMIQIAVVRTVKIFRNIGVILLLQIYKREFLYIVMTYGLALFEMRFNIVKSFKTKYMHVILHNMYRSPSNRVVEKPVVCMNAFRNAEMSETTGALLSKRQMKKKKKSYILTGGLTHKPE